MKRVSLLRGAPLLSWVALVTFMAGNAGAAPNLAVDPNSYVLVSQAPATKGKVDFSYTAEVVNSGSAANGVSAAAKAKGATVTVTEGNLSFGDVAAGGRKRSTDTFTIRRDPALPWDPIATPTWTTSFQSAPNQPPIANAGADQRVFVGVTVTLNGAASTDPDGNALTYRWTMLSRPAGSKAMLKTGSSVSKTFSADRAGRYEVQLIVNDGTVDSTADLVVVQADAGNTAPVANAGPDRTAGYGSTVQLDGTGSSDVNGDPLTFIWTFVTRPAGSQAALTAANSATPSFVADAVGDFVVSLVVNDGQANSAPDTVTIAASNTAPVANAGPDQTVAIGTLAQLDGSQSSDTNGNPLTYSWSLLSKPATSTATLAGGTTATPSFTADANGEYVAQLIVNDGLTNSAGDTVLISTLNSAPVANAGPDQTVATGVEVTLDGNASNDADSDPLSFGWAITTKPAGSAAQLDLTDFPIVHFTADLDGLYIAQLIVNDGRVASAPDTVQVTARDNVPRANPDSAATAEDTAVLIDVVTNDVDPLGGSLTPEITASPVHGTAVIQGSSVLYTPGADFHGADGFSYRVSNAEATSAPATVAVTLTPVNDPPVAVGDAAATDAGVQVTIAALANDSDVDGDSLSITLVASPTNGSATTDGVNVRYTSAAGFDGVDSFDYTISDGTATATATITVTVTDATPPLVANDDTYTGLEEDDAVGLPVLANDSGGSGPLTIFAVAQPAHGTVENRGTDIVYRPAANYFGSDSFSYTATDGQASDTAAVSVTINPVNDPPVAVNDTAITDQNVAVTIAVLANDVDIDSAALAVTAVGTSANATITTNGTTVTYTPSPAFFGSDSFTYTVSDGSLSATGTVSVTVNQVDGTAPVVTPNIVGTLGNPGWYVSGVEVTWTVTDAESAIDSSTGCERVYVIEDTAGRTLTCSATSVGGTNTQSVTIKKDSSPPAIRFPTPAPGAGFYTGQSVQADYECTDVGSGVNTCNGTVSDGSSINTATNGEKTFEVTGTDQAGNTQTFTRKYNVVPQGTVIITTVAGGGPIDSVPALSMGLSFPFAVAVDANGNHYIAAGAIHRVLRIDASGAVTTVAGNATRGFSGDNGPATAASLSNPAGVALDAAGNLYIADDGNHRIRRVDPAGTITTVAGNGTFGFSGDGGLATAANLRNPSGVALDTSGNLYIADQGNHRIRRVDPAGTITTVAGNGTAGFSGDNAPATAASLRNPIGVALDAGGNLYIADQVNQRIRRVDPAGTITTMAGNGTAGFSGDGSAATAASLSSPTGIALDAAGNLYIAERGSQRIRRVDPAGTITTVAGNGTFSFSGDNGSATAASLRAPSGVAFDGAGNLYIADTGNHRIRRVDPAGTITTVAGNTFDFSGDNGTATAASVRSPTGVALDAMGSLYTVDIGNHRIRRVDPDGTITTVAGNGTGGFSGDNGPATMASLNFPAAVAVDATGNIYIADRNSQRIRRVDPAGTITTVVGNGTFGFSGDNGPATAARLNNPSGVALDTVGNLYIADRDNHRVRRVDQSGTITTMAGNGTPAAGGDGGPATAASLNSPTGVALDAAGYLYIADTSNGRIRRVESSGTITTVAGNAVQGFSGDNGPATAASLAAPSGLAFDDVGNLFIADQNNQRIRRVDPAGTITTVAGNGTFGFSGDNGPATAARLNSPTGVALDAVGNLYIADLNNQRIRRVGPVGGYVDATAPVVSANVAGTSGTNGWYTGNVTVTWTVSDPDSPILSLNGCGATSVTTDTAGQTLTCTATSGGGPTTQSVTIKRDTAAPTASLLTPANDASYEQNSVVNADYNCTDATAGVASCTGPGASGAPIDTATPGAKSFAVIATDTAGNTATGTHTYTVSAVAPPVAAVADSTTTLEDQPVTVAVLSNDTGGGAPLAITAVTQGTNGAVSIVGLSVQYTPAANFNGGDSFSYTASDGTTSSSATVTVTVTPGNDPLAANDDTAATDEDTAAILAVLGNDTDIDGDTLSLSAVTQGSRGSVAISGTTVTYTPNANVSGADSFSYTATDGQESDTATVSVTINPVNDAPVPVNDTAITDQNVAVTIDVLTNDVDIDSAALAVTAVGTSPNATITTNGTTVTYTPSPAFFGSDSFTYTVSDGSLSATATVTVTVNEVDGTAPLITPTVVGTLGNGGWYVSGVEVTWTVSDAESEIDSSTGCERVYVIEDTAGRTLTCSATSVGGPSTQSVTIKKDASPPAIRFPTPAPGAGFYTGQSVQADFECTDVGSGVNSCSGTVSDGVSINTATTGEKTFEVSGTDQAGNTQTFSRKYNVVPQGTVIITTVAGGGPIDSMPALEAALSNPQGVAVDAAGNRYLADQDRSLILRIDPAGTITTVAGGGTNGLGDNGPATAVRLASPSDVALDTVGNLYIADAGASRIRRVDKASGVITTVAGDGSGAFSGDGGAATAASIGIVSGVALDAAGNLYIADQGNHRIRRVDSTGTITTVAGNGTAEFFGDGGAATAASLSAPSGIAANAAGHLYIADRNNQRVRRVDAVSGVITTVAGNGTAGFSGDNGPATAARLNSPTGVGIDAAGNLYIADESNRRIRRVDSAGTITTVAGNGAASGFSGDGGAATAASLPFPSNVALDVTGNLYIVERSNRRVHRVDAASGVISTVAGNGTKGFSGDGGPATSAGLSAPSSIVANAGGNLYIADQSNQRIRRVDSTGTITTVAGNGTSGFSGDGGPATVASVSAPSGIAANAVGDLYIADTNNQRIRRVDTVSGVITTVAGNGSGTFSGDGGAATTASLQFPRGVAIDVAGNLYIADTNNQRIRRVDTVSSVITTVAGNGTAGFSGDNGPATAARLNFPVGVALDAAGNLYVADQNNHRIRRVDSTGTITTLAGNGVELFAGDGGAATAASIRSPSGVALDVAGNLYIADQNNSRIRRVDAVSGLISTMAGTGGGAFSGDGGPATAASISNPYGIALDTVGNLYIATQRIRRVGPAGGYIDATPPTVAANVAGTSGTNGWYTGNVTVTWTVSDPDSPILSLNGCGATSVTTDTAGQTLTCTATSGGGPTTQSVTIKRDTAAPTASLLTPANDASYEQNSVVNADYNCTDATAGVASCTGPGASGAPIDTATPGAKSFAVIATDTAGNTATGTHTYTVSAVAPPVAAVADSTTTLEDQPVTVAVLSNDTGGGAPLAITAVTQGTNGAVSIVGLSVQYTPAANFNGGDSFSYTASDGTTSSSATVTVTVTPGNDPLAANDDTAATDEDTAAILAVLGNDTDIDGDTLSLSAVTQGSRGSVAISGTTVTYTPNANVSGADSFSYTATDGQESDTATVSVTINPVNDAPVPVNDTAITDQNVAVTIDVLTNDVDIDSAALAVTAVGTSPNATITTNGTTVTYTPSPAFFGSDSFTYTVSDGSLSATATVTVTVNEVDGTAPLITPTVVGTLGNGGWYVSGVEVTWTVSDAESEIDSSTGCERVYVIEDTAGRTLTCSATSVGGPSTQSVTIKKDASPPAIRFPTPAPGAGFYTGQSVQADFECTDVGSGVNSCSGTVSDGVSINTATTGEKTFEVSGTDQAGNTQTFSRKYNVVPQGTVIITTVAGGGPIDSMQALQAPLGEARGVAVDAAGNGYIVARSQNRVLKLDPSGAITTAAGNGAQGFSGDNGPATAASLNLPTAVAIDAAGNLYIADQGNHRIRRVDTAGTITTVAGNGVSGFSGDNGPATAARLFQPNGIALDAAGNLYIADRANHRIRRIDAVSNVINTVAGNGTPGFLGDGGAATVASLNSPSGIGFDAVGSFYIADQSNHRIRQVDSSGIITSVAGNGSGGFSGDGGPATAGRLDRPEGIALDAAGNLYIADRSNNRIRRVDPAGTITTVAGNGVQGFFGDNGPATAAGLLSPAGVALDAAGALYIADASNRRIRRVGPSGTITTAAGNGTSGFSGDGDPATAANLTNPTGIALDAAGNLYIGDQANQRVRRVDPAGTITTVAGNGVQGFFGDNGPATAANLSDPTGVALNSAGNLYVADQASHRIRRVDPAGTITTVAGNGTQGFSGDNGPATAASLSRPTGVALDAAGNLYVADQINHRIRRVDPTGTITTVAGNGTAGFSGDNGSATAASLSFPFGVALDTTGNIYIADQANHRIRRVDPAGTITTVAGNGLAGSSGDNGPATAARLSSPFAVAVDATGNLYVADQNNHRIRRVDPAGTIMTVAGNGAPEFSGDGGAATAARLSSPFGVGLDAAGTLYIADRSNQRIRRVGPAGGYVDATPPVVAANVAGTSGTNGWYTSNVTVSWTVSDPDSPILSSNGCGPTSVTTDTAGQTLTCTATSAGGTWSQSVTLKRDATIPLVSLITPANGAIYDQHTTVNADYSCSDSLAGLASCAGTGANATPIDTATTGSKTFTVTATDAAGNTASTTHGYTVGDAPEPADVALQHFLNNPAPVVGGSVSYTVQVNSFGPAVVNAAQASWVVGDGLTVTEVTPSQGSYNAQTGVWNIGGIAVGAAPFLQITATVNETGNFTATASFLSSDRPDPDAANNQPITQSLTPNYNADVALQHFLNNPAPVVGGSVSYTVQVNSFGPAVVNAAQASWVVGDGLTVTEVTPSQGSYNAQTGVWNIGGIAVGAAPFLQITATVNETGNFTATASFLSSDRPDPDAANNQPITQSLTPNYNADVALQHFLNNPAPVVGGSVSYTVQVNSFGPAVVNAAQASWVVGDGLTVTEVTPSQGSYNAQTGVWNIGGIAVGAAPFLQITATVNETGNFTATASFLSSDRPDPDAANNQPITQSLTPNYNADVALQHFLNNPAPVVGGSVSYTVQVNSFGPAVVNAAQASWVVGDGLTVTEVTPSQGSYNAQTGVWNIGGIAVGAAPFLQITATVNETGNFTATASFLSSDRPDPDAANNQPITQSLTPNYNADVALQHFLNNPAPVVGGSVSYTVQVNSFGPAVVNAAQASWVVGDGLTVTEVTPSQGSYNAQTGVWNIGGIAVGAAPFLQITATVNETGNFTATASFLSSDRPDPDAANNQPITQSLTPNYNADVALQHFLNNPAPVVGGSVSYTVQVNSFGPAVVNAAQASWVVGDGLTVTEVTPSQGSYNAQTGVWNIGGIAVGAAPFLQITATVNETGNFTATASFLSSDRPDPDAANNQPITQSLTPTAP